VAATSFAVVAEAYQGFRKTYPDQLFDILSALCPPESSAWVVDVGAGTGLVASAMAARRLSTLAIEPSRAMIRRRTPSAAHWVLGKAEALPVSPRSAQLVTVGQAFHWFDSGLFLKEALRVLQPGRCLAIFWEGPAATEPYRAVVHQCLNELLGESDARADPGAMRGTRDWVLSRLKDAELSHVEKTVIGFDRTWTLDEFLGFMSSISRFGKLDGSARSRFAGDVRRMFRDNGLSDAFTERNEIELFIGRAPRSRAGLDRA